MPAEPYWHDDRGVTGEIDLSRLGRVLRAKRWWVIGPALVAFAAAFLFVSFVKPRYTAEALVLLENQESFLPRLDKNDSHGPEVAPDAEAVQTQLQLLESRDLARRAIKVLQLQGNEEFDPLAKGVPIYMRPLVLLGFIKDPTQIPPEERILDAFAERLDKLSPPKTRVLTIKFSSRDPDLAARGANTVADAYLAFQQDAKRESARQAAKSLAALVTELRGRASQADARAEEFRAKSGLLIGANNTTINAQRLSDLNTQLSLSRGAQAEAQAKAKLLKEMLRQRRIGDIPDVANNEVMRKLQEQRVTLRAQLALELRTLLPGHPRIKELEAQLADLDRQNRSAAERVVRTLENDARIAGARVENLSQALEEQKKVVGVGDAEEVQLHELERSARLYNEQLESATAKYQDALARENAEATPADARIFQRALAPQVPSFPKKVPILAFSTLATSFLAILSILAAELLSGRAQTLPPRDITAQSPTLRGTVTATGDTFQPLSDSPEYSSPIQARAAKLDQTLTSPASNLMPEVGQPTRVVPTSASEASELSMSQSRGGDDARVLSHEPVEVGADLDTPPPETPQKAKRELAPVKENEMSVDGENRRRSRPCVRTIAVRGDYGPEGFVTVVSLARSLAGRGKSVLVVADCADRDFDRLISHEAENPKGLQDLLAGNADFGDVIHRDEETSLHIIPAGDRDARGTQVYDLQEVIDALAHAYEFIVVCVANVEGAIELGALFNKIVLRGAIPIRAEVLDSLCKVCQDVSLIQDALADLVAA